MQKASSSIEEVPVCFSGASIKFQGHTGWKIDDFNPIGVRLLGRSQLSNPSDLPCYYGARKQVERNSIHTNGLISLSLLLRVEYSSIIKPIPHCWCPDSFYHKDNSLVYDYNAYISPCLSWGKNSTTCAVILFTFYISSTTLQFHTYSVKPYL